ncbi:RNA polymerase sigma factor [Planotetraspora kaengkrachanensis]|uniref:DNA-directed RNA polymerase sigma-70 factor n=1 Tax=Planotetraspora kaengkrachanensis TaxID=575193 RepID=A0A8J3LX23_9ACTN|nr:sigma-70 family RNA polymerase sigma factor [Planotetraspora kaengkrachanensis]GIG79439.1 DNA-directed RNA polymerase sigma-70 factor [Planotetraspora kaengkrachanensis]
MAEDSTLADLVVRAQKGDQDAWGRIVERYAPFVWAICNRYRLNRQDRDDVAQMVWLRTVEKLGSLQQPEAFAGWLATVTQRECLHASRAVRRRESNEHALDLEREMGDESVMIGRELERFERRAALRAAFAQLPPHCRQLLLLLAQEQQLSYREIAERLCVSIGGIGPTRGRCLARLRRSPHLKGFLGPAAGSAGGGGDA